MRQPRLGLAWYVLQAHVRREKRVTQVLRTMGFEVCLPVRQTIRRWSDRRKELEVPVFPGYVFCEFDASVRQPVLELPGVLSILGGGDGPIPLEGEEVRSLQVLERAKAPADPWPYVKVGDWVTIEGGALDGLVGILTTSKKNMRVVVSVGLLERSVAVQVDRAAIRPTNPPKRNLPLQLLQNSEVHSRSRIA